MKSFIVLHLCLIALAYQFATGFLQSERYPTKQTAKTYFDPDPAPNSSLEVDSDVVNEWKVSRTNINKWFEYYGSTAELKEAASNVNLCPSVISDLVRNLENASGIWVACQDPQLLNDCHAFPEAPCHPRLSYKALNLVELHRVKIRMRIYGFALVRLSLGAGPRTCFEYGNRKDPFSTCEFIDISKHSGDGWIQIETTLPESIREFTLEPLARFQDDLVLIDRIETTVRPRVSILDIEGDADSRWRGHMSALNPDWFNFHYSSASIQKPENESLNCANTLYSVAQQLPQVNGLWSACPVPLSVLRHPWIWHDKLMTLIYHVHVAFYLVGFARIRLHVENVCYDYALMTHPDVNSSCTFQRVEQSGYSWSELDWVSPATSPLALGQAMKMELIATFPSDAVVLDSVIVHNFYNIGPTNPTTQPPQPANSFLDVREDLQDERWELPSLFPNWLDYHDNSASIKEPTNATFSCSSILHAIAQDLSSAEGLWSSCHEITSSLKTINEENTNVSGYPVIKYSAQKEIVISIKAKYYLFGFAMLRLRWGSGCIDFSVVKDSYSDCDFQKIVRKEEYWRDWREVVWSPSSTEQVTEFTLELITANEHDLVLLDKIVVNYQECESGQCLPSTTMEMTSTTLTTLSTQETTTEVSTTEVPTSRMPEATTPEFTTSEVTSTEFITTETTIPETTEPVVTTTKEVTTSEVTESAVTTRTSTDIDLTDATEGITQSTEASNNMTTISTESSRFTTLSDSGAVTFAGLSLFRFLFIGIVLILK